MLPVDAGLEMQVFGGGASGTSGQGYGLSCFYGVTALHEVFEVMAVYGFQSEGVAHYDDIAVCTVWFGHPYHTIESAADRIFGTGLDVYAAMVPARTSIGRNDFGSGQGKGVCCVGQGVEVYLYLIGVVEQSRSSYADVVNLHGGERRILGLRHCGESD